MKTCPFCNQSIEESDIFCPHCGQKQETQQTAAPAQSDEREQVQTTASVQSDEREKALYIFRRNLRHERKCWSIFGGVYLGFSIFFFAFSLLYLVLAVGLKTAALAAVFPVFFLYGILILPIAIIGLVMSSKITGYLNELETNPNPAVERSGSVWLIVMGALFNNIALIFIILNFIHVKTHKEQLQQ
ncbi:MAG: hypothetical protein J6B54_00295 [Clostridia bacterium]|nr:hypothetical protein [Clostridia bacterium]